MKRTILLLCIVLSAVATKAQLKPEKGDKGFQFNLTGLANLGLSGFQTTNLEGILLDNPAGLYNQSTINLNALMPTSALFFRYYLEDDKVLRVALGAGYLDREIRTSSIQGSGTTIDYQQFKAFSGGIGIGYEQHYTSAARRIDPYGGLQVNFGYSNGLSGIVEEEFDYAGNADFERTTTEFDYPGGWRITLDLIGGFNYFIADNVAIGGEFAVGPYFTNFNGDWSATRTFRSELGGQTTVETENYTGNSINRSLGFAMGGSTGFHLVVFF